MNRKILCILLMGAMLLGALCGCKAQKMELEQISEQAFYERPLSQRKVTDEEGLVYYAEDALKVVSYNIRYKDDKDGLSIKERAPRLEKVLSKYDPDIIGAQEFTTRWEPQLDRFTDTYDYILTYRAPSDLESAPIFWKAGKFELLDHGTFWLSETPDQQSIGWGADLHRICTWAKFKVRATGTVFYFLNTHFDFTDAPQEGSAKLLIEKAQSDFKDAPVIITGDFNMEQDSKGYSIMSSYFTDVNMATVKDTKTGTYTGYGKESELIDYTFVTKEGVKPLTYRVMTDLVEDKFVSDHYGIYSELILY